ncbi:flagellin [Salinispirillum sp. LH 10-3-1]|uniref:Flagellin n=1 Tax=Salinispirillum sp. LH 10-3-1 TaxID=2952525 RepID=A0AB38YFH5_9GAMM
MAVSLNASPSIPSTSQFTQLAKQGSTGLRINSAADDAAGVAIAQGFTSQGRGMTVAMRNLGDGMSLLQTRSGTVSGFTEQVQRMRELTIQANNATNGPQERDLLNREFTALRDSIVEQVGSAAFNGRPLFGDGAQTFQTGPNAGQTTVVEGNALPDALAEIDFSNLTLNSSGDLGNVIERLDDTLSAFTASQVQDGAVANRFEQQSNNLSQQRLDNAASLSRIQDLDFAKLASDLAQDDTRSRAQILLQSQANANRGDVLRLISS